MHAHAHIVRSADATFAEATVCCSPGVPVSSHGVALSHMRDLPSLRAVLLLVLTVGGCDGSDQVGRRQRPLSDSLYVSARAPSAEGAQVLLEVTNIRAVPLRGVRFSIADGGQEQRVGDLGPSETRSMPGVDVQAKRVAILFCDGYHPAAFEINRTSAGRIAVTPSTVVDDYFALRDEELKNKRARNWWLVAWACVGGLLIAWELWTRMRRRSA